MNLPPLKFHSFKEAVSYKSACPLCTNELHINDRDLATDYTRTDYGRQVRLAFYVNQREQDTVVLDPENDAVELITTNRVLDTVYGIGSTIPVTITPPPVYNGLFLHGLTIDCKSCCQYSFTLQIHFDLSEQKLFGVFLNSENVSIEEGDMVHEIKNSYASQITYYSYFDKEGDSKKLTLPLIPLDLSEPKETVARIRKLLIFS